MKSNLPIDEALYEQGYNQAIKDLDDFNWSSFRREAAKDMACAIVNSDISGGDGKEFAENVAKAAIMFADELISQLKEEKK